MDEITVAIEDSEGQLGKVAISDLPQGVRFGVMMGIGNDWITPVMIVARLSPSEARAIALGLNLAATAHEGRAHDADGRCLDPVRFGCPDMPH